MSKTSPTIVITDTDRLSALADAILANAGNPRLKKNTVLNLIAGSLAGSRTNWGGLKAMASPAIATDHADEALLDDIDDAPEVAPYSLEGTSLVLRMPHPHTFATQLIAVGLTDLPALQAALFGKDAPGEYACTHATFETLSRDEIGVTARLFDGATAEIGLDWTAFRDFLLRNRGTILDGIVADDGAGEAVHRAFITVAEGQGEDILYDVAQEYPAIEAEVHTEGSEANTRRIERACRDATWTFLAGASEHGERRHFIRRGPHVELANVIVDYEWETIAEALRDAFDAAR